MKGCFTAIGIVCVVFFVLCSGLVGLSFLHQAPKVKPVPLTKEQQQANEVAKKQRLQQADEDKAKQDRLSAIRSRDRQITREAKKLEEDMRYERNRFELGETTESQARASAARFQALIQSLTDERKRLENELYEIKSGTWTPKN